MDVFTTKSGRIRGRRAARDHAVVAVLGIPYAAPPFGARRFREPQPAEPWDGVRECRDRAGRRVRAWHCADIPFAFGNLHEESVHFLVGGPPGPADEELSRRMTRAWAGFAAHGDPGWAPLDGPEGSGATVRIWRTAAEGPGLEHGFRDLWRTAGLPLLEP